MDTDNPPALPLYSNCFQADYEAYMADQAADDTEASLLAEIVGIT